MPAAIRINVKHDLDKLKRQLDDLGKRQIPFAAASALTAVARAAAKQVSADMPTTFDRPTPFTLRGPGITPARKNNLRAEVFIKDRQAQYLAIEETGGTRLPHKVALVVPAGINLNKYGNVSKGRLERLKGRSDVFVGQVTTKSGKVIGGFWQRMPNHHLKLLAAFKPKGEYHAKFGYHATVKQVVTSKLPILLRDALARAIRTARP